VIEVWLALRAGAHNVCRWALPCDEERLHEDLREVESGLDGAWSCGWMILQERGEELWVIRQTDHGLLAGFLARQWGNDLFRRPEGFESFCLAVREHDNGWGDWELAPRIDPKTRVPYTFMSIPTEEHAALYQRGIERVVQVDRYAGLLVSLHCAGLYDRSKATIPGFSAKYVKSTESRVVSEFLQSLKLQQLRLKVDLRGSPATKGLTEEKCLETSESALEALDRLSLYFCLNSLAEATIDNVPLHADQETPNQVNPNQESRGQGSVDWELRPIGGNSVSLTPYPFRKDPLRISILARHVPKRIYGDDLDFQRTLALAPYFAVEFTLHAADDIGRTRSAVA
jgi:hypothetical protein